MEGQENSGTTLCFICDQDLITDQDEVITVTRGLEILISVSKQRHDNHHLFLQKQSSLEMHSKCRLKYAAIRQGKLKYANTHFAKDSTKRFDALCSPNRKKRREDCPPFNFEANCFFCGKPASIEHWKKTRGRCQRFCVVGDTRFRDTILDEIKNGIQGESGKVVLQRIALINLVAARARYHKNFRTLLQSRGKIPEDLKKVYVGSQHVCDQMDAILKHIVDTDEQIYNLDDLKTVSGNPPIAHKTLIRRLNEVYGEFTIGFTSVVGSGSFMYFKDSEYEIMKKQWMSNALNKEDEETRILDQATAIIRRHIVSMPPNRSEYPPSDCILDRVVDNIPDKLQYFMNKIILTNKNKDQVALKRKSNAISHSILAVVRLRRYLSHLQLGLGVLLFRKFASRYLIDILFQLGYCVSYSEVLRYQNSTMCAPRPEIKKGSFAQFIFDNCDFNTDTIDGNNTFHGMAGIVAVTPVDCYRAKQAVVREKKNISQKVINDQKFVWVMGMTTRGIGISQLPNLTYRNSVFPILTIPIFLWLYGRAVRENSIIGWNGFMGKLTQNMPYERSRIICLSFVEQPPSKPDTIFTAEQAKKLGLHTCFVTFDQPLYQKATEIVKCAEDGDPISKIVTRLVGFHLILSYLGTFGFIMSGSGLEELMGICYAAGTSKKMLYGHAYHRAMRAHSLVLSALCKRIFAEIEFSDDEKTQMEDYLGNSDGIYYSDIENCEFIRYANEKFIQKMNEIQGRGKTAKLWIQYMQMFQIVKCFLKSEKMGDLVFQLKCIEQMLPYFHASGHFNYARSTHLYVQEMRAYMKSMDRLAQTEGGNKNDARLIQYEKFVKQGFNTIRRTDKFWSGTFTDMTIEQDFMRMVKVNGGLVKRGFNTNASTKFIQSLPFMIDICHAMEGYCGITSHSSDQHVDARDCSVERDQKDLKKMVAWIEVRDPFMEKEELVSLETGLVGGEHVNAHEAFAVGTESILSQVRDRKFSEISFKRKYRVTPLMNATNSIKVKSEDVCVDPLLIFQRICLRKESRQDLKNYFNYQLAPFPMSLFDKGLMQKTAKSALLKLFSATPASFDKKNCVHVVDGGMLIHRVPWNLGETFDLIFSRYVRYLKEHYSSEVVVVFDGYELNYNSTKGAERSRRANNKSCPNIQVDANMTLVVSKEKFLSNTDNKMLFIRYLKSTLEANKIFVTQAVDDADTLIVETALKKYSGNGRPVVVVAEDIDILVLLTALTPRDQTIYFLKVAKGNKPQEWFSSRSLGEHSFILDNILFLHAISGCDTTSALFMKGKTTIVTGLEKKCMDDGDHDLLKAIKSFKSPNLSRETEFESGKRVLLSIYKAPQKASETLGALRFHIFEHFKNKKSPFKLANLPPTDEAARQHLSRVYLQVQNWLGNELLPEEWGWKLAGDVLSPIQTTEDPVHPDLLKMISCQCMLDCGKNCSCIKAGLKCSILCGSCHTGPCCNCNDMENDDVTVPEKETVGGETGAGQDEVAGIEPQGEEQEPEDVIEQEAETVTDW